MFRLCDKTNMRVKSAGVLDVSGRLTACKDKYKGQHQQNVRAMTCRLTSCKGECKGQRQWNVRAVTCRLTSCKGKCKVSTTERASHDLQIGLCTGLFPRVCLHIFIAVFLHK